MLTAGDIKKLAKFFATKDDLVKLEARIDSKMMGRLLELEARIEEKAAKRHSELFDLVNGLAKEIRDSREFRAVVEHQLDKVRRRLDL